MHTCKTVNETPAFGALTCFTLTKCKLFQITGAFLCAQIFILKSLKLNVAKRTQNLTFFKGNEETSNYFFASLSPNIYFPSCEPGMIPWRRMDIKYTIPT